MIDGAAWRVATGAALLLHGGGVAAAELALVVGVGASKTASGQTETHLVLADDDAWRMASLLATRLPPHQIDVLTQIDESTAGLRFPGGAPRAPTRAGLLEAAARLLDEAGPGPHRLIVYIAAHGTAEDLYLEDGPTSVAALREALHARLGPSDELLLAADACYSRARPA